MNEGYALAAENEKRKTDMKPAASRCLLCAAPIATLTAALALSTIAQPASAAPLAWEKLAQQPGALSAIATAISMSGTCKVPFTFDQSREGETLIVTVACANTGDGAGAIKVKFDAIGKRLFVSGYEFEG